MKVLLDNNRNIECPSEDSISQYDMGYIRASQYNMIVASLYTLRVDFSDLLNL